MKGSEPKQLRQKAISLNMQVVLKESNNNPTKKS